MKISKDLVIISRWKSVELDEMFDFWTAEMIIKSVVN